MEISNITESQIVTALDQIGQQPVSQVLDEGRGRMKWPLNSTRNALLP